MNCEQTFDHPSGFLREILSISNIIILAARFQSTVVFSSSIFEINFKFLQQQFEILRVCAKNKMFEFAEYTLLLLDLIKSACL